MTRTTERVLHRDRTPFWVTPRLCVPTALRAVSPAREAYLEGVLRVQPAGATFFALVKVALRAILVPLTLKNRLVADAVGQRRGSTDAPSGRILITDRTLHPATPRFRSQAPLRASGFAHGASRSTPLVQRLMPARQGPSLDGGRNPCGYRDRDWSQAAPLCATGACSVFLRSAASHRSLPARPPPRAGSPERRD